jgi:hypothetical protein
MYMKREFPSLSGDMPSILAVCGILTIRMVYVGESEKDTVPFRDDCLSGLDGEQIMQGQEGE